MKGTRRQPDENGWFNDRLQPGEYVRIAPVRNADGTPLSPEHNDKWWMRPYYLACSPNGHCGNLGNHEIIEHEDGTITVKPSIRITGKEGVELFHGFLERGVWRDA